MPTVNYLRITDSEHSSAYEYESYRIGNRNGKKLVEANLWSHQLKQISSKDDE